MKLITIHLPEPYIKAIDQLVNERKLYSSRAEAIRAAVRDLLVDEAWGVGAGEANVQPVIKEAVDWTSLSERDEGVLNKAISVDVLKFNKGRSVKARRHIASGDVTFNKRNNRKMKGLPPRLKTTQLSR